MSRRWVPILMTLLLTLGAAVAARAATQGCYYDPHTFLGLGCSPGDMAMIGLKTGMSLTAAKGDTDAFWDLRAQAAALEKDPFSLWVKLDEPLASYQVLDSVAAGPNIRFASIPTKDGPRLLITDRLGKRPIRIAESHTAGWYNRPVDWLQSLTWGYVIPDPAEYLLRGETAGLGDALRNGVEFRPVVTVDGASKKGVTEYLVDVLHTDPKGHRTVYRKQIFVDGSGHLRVVDVEKPWSAVREVLPGEAW